MHRSCVKKYRKVKNDRRFAWIPFPRQNRTWSKLSIGSCSLSKQMREGTIKFVTKNGRQRGWGCNKTASKGKIISVLVNSQKPIKSRKSALLSFLLCFLLFCLTTPSYFPFLCLGSRHIKAPDSVFVEPDLNLNKDEGSHALRLSCLHFWDPFKQWSKYSKEKSW